MLYETHHADRLHTLMTMSWVSRASVYTCIHAPTAPRTCLSGKCVSIPYGFPWISSSLPLPPYPSTQLSLQIRLVILGNINYNNSKIIIIISISRALSNPFAPPWACSTKNLGTRYLISSYLAPFGRPSLLAVHSILNTFVNILSVSYY